MTESCQWYLDPRSQSQASHTPSTPVSLASGVTQLHRTTILSLYIFRCSIDSFMQTGLSAAIFLSQLERVAVNVSRNAMPSNADNSELANRLAMQAAALEADNLDPLGLGRIDGHALSLVSELGHWTCSLATAKPLLISTTACLAATASAAHHPPHHAAQQDAAFHTHEIHSCRIHLDPMHVVWVREGALKQCIFTDVRREA